MIFVKLFSRRSNDFVYFSLNFKAYFCYEFTKVSQDLYYFYEYGGENNHMCSNLMENTQSISNLTQTNCFVETISIALLNIKLVMSKVLKSISIKHESCRFVCVSTFSEATKSTRVMKFWL